MNLRHRRVARVALAVLATAACVLLMREAARIGFSRILTRYAIATNSLPAAEQAIQLTPADPEAHRARALILNRLRRPAEAEASLAIATSLRAGPEDLWIELGNTREELGDREGALAALNQAVRAAPYYWHTHWQRGNLLLRMGRHDEAFVDLRQAATANAGYFRNLIDLAWGLTDGSAGNTEALLQFRNDEERLAFARFLASKGKGAEVIDQISLLTTSLSDENREELLRLLSAARSSGSLAGLWTGSKKLEDIVNPGFEEPLKLGQFTPGWSFFFVGPELSADVSEKMSGQRSLQVSFSGSWNTGASVLAQAIAVKPGVTYRLSFAVKTKDLVTGGPPRIVVTEVTNENILAKSKPLGETSGTWQTLNVDFSANVDVVMIRLVRDNCASSPCPIFGVVWLDDFSLRQMADEL